MKRTKLDDPRFYLNRHLEWLEFNRRVLEEARDIGNPLLERVKFLAITANNLDEFVEVRVASFLQRIEHGSREIGTDGLTAAEELEKVSAAMHVMVRDQYRCWNEELLPALAKAGIRVLPASKLEGKAAQAARTFYERRVSPMLTPVTVDPAHPFPHVLNKALCIAFLLRRRRSGNGKPYFGVLTVPRGCRACCGCLRQTAGFTTSRCRKSSPRTLQSFIGVTKFWRPRRSGLRGTATFIWKKKRRGACSMLSIRRFRSGARAMLCVSRSTPKRIRTSSTALSRHSNWMKRWSFAPRVP